MGKQFGAIVVLFALAGCPESRPAPQRVVCVGDSGLLAVTTGQDTESVTVTSARVRAAFNGRVDNPGHEADSVGAVKEVKTTIRTVIDPSKQITYEFYCVRKGLDDLEVSSTSAGESAPPKESFEISCEECSDSGVEDPLGDFLDSVSANMPTYKPAQIDIVRSHAKLFQMMPSSGLATALECDVADGELRVVCAETPPASLLGGGGEASEHYWVYMSLDADVPAKSDHSLIYSAVIESDNVTENDWIAQDPFDWDLFQGTDRWYQLVYDHNADIWLLEVTQVDDAQNQTSVSSGARAIIDKDQVVFLIPAPEIPSATPSVRTTAFGHDGLFSESDRGADVSGADPTVTPFDFE